VLRRHEVTRIRALHCLEYPQHRAEGDDPEDSPPVRVLERRLCISSPFFSFRTFPLAELLTRCHSVLSAPRFLDLAGVLEDSTGAEPAKRFRRSLLSRVGSHVPQEPLHVGNGQEGTAVVVEGLVLVLLEAAPEMQGECVDGVLLVACQFFYVRNERKSQSFG